MFTQLSNWFSSLDTSMQVFWACAIAATIVFVIQNLLMLLGIGDMDSDVDADVSTDFDVHTDIDSFDGASDIDISSGHSGHEGTLGSAGIFSLFTLRNFINFCLGFGWTAVLLHDDVKSNFLVMVIAIIVGVALVAAVMWMFKWLSSMQQSGNIDVHTAAVGCEGKAYLTIPGERKGEGKIQITINNAIREYDALTEGDTIPTGTPIKVIGVINDHTLLVEEVNPTII